MKTKSHIDKLLTVNFSSLKEGLHQFQYSIDDTFFENFELSQIKHGMLDIRLDFERKTDMLIFMFTIIGEVKVPCDICLEDTSVHISSKNILYVKFGETPKEETEDLYIIPYQSNDFCFSHFLYEIIHLELPMKCVHPDNEEGEPTCNQEMLLLYQKLQKNDNSGNDTWKDLLKFSNPDN